MRLPQDKIDEIRQTVDIVEVIGNSVRLKKSGRNFTGLCPFHSEKTPSFMVNPEMQIFKCFGCGTGGNVFTFLMKDQNITFFDAVKQLAEKTGIKLPRYQEDREEKRDLEKYYAINEFAAEWYRKNLWESKTGNEALRYLRDRGFREHTLHAFDVGFALDNWEGLVRTARKASFSKDVLIETGLALKRQNDGSPYDRFRNRIMFPIRDQFGRIVGFGGRKFDDSEGPKYVNSPESPVYHKGRLLYGLYQNRESVRKHDIIILVEGYTDVMALHEYGIKLGVASLGTGFTPNQARLIKRHTLNVVLLYDADAAGIKAALRGSEVLFGADLGVSVVNLGKGADPDSFLRNNKVEAFYDKMKNRQSIVEFYASSFDKSQGEISYDEQARRVHELIDLIDSVRDHLKRDLLLKEVGEKLSADEKSVFKEYYRKRRSKSQFQRRAQETDSAQSQQRQVYTFDPIERDLGRLLVREPALSSTITAHIDDNDIRNPLIKQLLAIVRNISGQNRNYSPADLISASENTPLEHVIPDLSLEEHSVTGAETTESELKSNLAEGIVIRLKIRRIETGLTAIQDDIRNAESKNADTSGLIKKYQELLQLKNDLLKQDA